MEHGHVVDAVAPALGFDGGTFVIPSAGRQGEGVLNFALVGNDCLGLRQRELIDEVFGGIPWKGP